MTEIDVRLERVSKLFGELAAVDDLSLDIAEGEFFSMLGPSGCGKTTTLRMIGGFEDPTEGRIFLGGDEITQQPPYKRDVNTVFQSYALFPHLNVEKNVAFGLERRKVGKDEVRRRVGEALELVQLGQLGRRKPAQLSGGQQQRVALARARCCSTSRSARSTCACASSCRSSSSASSRTSASRSCTSRTTRRRP